MRQLELIEQELKRLSTDNENKRSHFPRKDDLHCYFNQYYRFSEHLYTNVHSHVMAGATLNDGGLLTDHGPEHIKTVIDRAYYLISETFETESQLSGYEIYLLLCAIHVHDVGNIFGRKDHESASSIVIKFSSELLGDDKMEQKLIFQIAQAHGGKWEDSKDTISALEEKTKLHTKSIRPRLLAAILRLSDELAEDYKRTSRSLKELDVIPEESKIYHKYAESLINVNIDSANKSIELDFIINANDTLEKYGKKTSSGLEHRYLIDEIIERTLKTHTEKVYCGRFLRGFVDIDIIDVRIEITHPTNHVAPPILEINYRLEEKGYPSLSPKIKELENWENLGALTGANLASRVNQELNGTPLP